MNDLLHELDRLALTYGEHNFFCLQGEESSTTYTFAQVRFAAAALAKGLAERGVLPGTALVCRLYNGVEAVIVSLAAAYGGFELALVSPRLTKAQYDECVSQLSGVALALEEADFTRLMLDACGLEFSQVAGLGSFGLNEEEDKLGLPAWIEGRLEAFDASSCGITLFAQNALARPKAVSLTWSRLTSSAREANDQLHAGKSTVWQLILPLCGIDGLQVMIRSLMNATPFVLYERYSTQRVLNDVLPLKVTHISVVETHLRDLLESDRDAVLCEYQCILLGGGNPPHDLLRAAGRASAHMVVAHSDDVKADLIAHGHELGLDCTYDKGYIELVSHR